MEKQLYMLAAIAILICACNSKNNRSDSTSRLVPEPDLVKRLEYQKTTIDTLYNRKDNIILFVKLADKDELQQITHENFPESVEISFSILKDSLGKIISASEFPVSQSGDWYIVLTHYFDQNGKTFAFERQTNYFNIIYSDGVAYETKTEYYNENFEFLSSQYKLVDEKNQPLQKDSCGHPYNYDCKVLSDADKYLQTKKIKIDR